MVMASLLIAIASGLVAAVYVFFGGFGLMMAFFAYSLVGATVLTASLTVWAYVTSWQVSSHSSDLS